MRYRNTCHSSTGTTKCIDYINVNFNVFLKSVWFTVNWPKEASIMEMIRPLFRSAKSLAKSAFTSNYLPLFYIIHDIEMTISSKFQFTQNIQLFHSQYSYLTVMLSKIVRIENIISYLWLAWNIVELYEMIYCTWSDHNLCASKHVKKCFNLELTMFVYKHVFVLIAYGEHRLGILCFYCFELFAPKEEILSTKNYKKVLLIFLH